MIHTVRKSATKKKNSLANFLDSAYIDNGDSVRTTPVKQIDHDSHCKKVYNKAIEKLN